MPKKVEEAEFGKKEAQRRTEAALRAAFSTPAKPQSEMKIGKRRTKRAGEKPKKEGRGPS